MTCPSLARRVAAPAEVGACLRTAVTSTTRAAARVAGDPGAGEATAQLARFAMVGGLATSVQVLLFTALAPAGVLPAYAVSWAVSTALANELHRRRTFRADERVGALSAQLEGGGLALLALLITSAALAALAVTAPDAGVGAQTILVLAVTATVGLLRFLALRWSFVVRRPHPA